MLSELRRQYGDLAGAQSGYHCFQNAVHNTSLAIHAGIERVSVLSVKTRVGVHAYLANGQNTYSEGLTWLTDYYPELTMREIVKLGGVDVTTNLLLHALNMGEDKYRYHRILEDLECSVYGITDSVARHLGV
jgi:hypothetical protein